MHKTKLSIHVIHVYETTISIAGEGKLAEEVDAIVRHGDFPLDEKAMLVDKHMSIDVLHVEGKPLEVEWRDNLDDRRKWDGRHVVLRPGAPRETLSAANVGNFLHACIQRGLDIRRTEDGIGRAFYKVEFKEEIDQKTMDLLREEMGKHFGAPPWRLEETYTLGSTQKPFDIRS